MRKIREQIDLFPSEEMLQSFADDYIAGRGLRCVRVPDRVFRLLNSRMCQLPPWARGMVNRSLGGLPDCTVLFDIGLPGLSLALSMELKTRTGRLHGQQRGQDWRVCRSPEDIVMAVDEAHRLAERLKGV